MQLYCYRDKQSGWGEQLARLAHERGHKVGLIKDHAQRPYKPGYFFSRVEQFPPLHAPSKALALRTCDEPGIVPIIAKREIEHYERKDLQAIDFFERGMPHTYVCRNARDCRKALQLLGAPLVSKSAFGSSCSNVRMLETEEEALVEAELALSCGLHTKRGVQKGYVIWQRYLPKNEYIYRVVAVGRWRWIFRESNRPGTRLASGSGDYQPSDFPAGDALYAFRAADNFFMQHGMKWCGVDMALDHHTGQWQVLETTIAWGLKHPNSSRGCKVIDRQTLAPHPKGYTGAQQFSLLLDEIEQGAFA
jgi:hypothetical protein